MELMDSNKTRENYLTTIRLSCPS